jgi:diadenosine tetraphosphate (Ap4A) HIT family hydrolase
MATDLHPRNARLLERIRAAESENGRLPTPDMAGWDVFPFEGDIRMRQVEEPVLPEPLRHGEGGEPCGACADGLSRAIWADDRWMLVPLRETSIPIVLLEPQEHLDSTDLDDSMAAELGLLTTRLERALIALGGVARVQVMKIGDGSAHLHVWFLARPEGLLQMRGSSLTDWADALPVLPDDEWLDLQREIAAGLAARGGRALV